MQKYALSLLLALVFSIWTLSDLQASIKNRPFSIHLDLYGIQPALNDSAQIWLFSPYFGADVQFMLSQRAAIVGSFRTGKVHNDSVSTSIFKFNRDRANRRWNFTSVALGPKFYLGQRGHTAPYFLTRLEMLLWNIKSYPDDNMMVVEGGDGNQRDYKATELGITTGFGLEQLFSDRIAFSIGAEFTYLTGLGADFAQWVKNSRSRGILQFGAGVSIHFGRKQQSLLKESETDEQRRSRVTRKVYEDDSEEEVNTKTVEQSDSPVQVDTATTVQSREAIVAQDQDRDGILDTLDKCIETPSGAIVDSAGCPLDSDKDGIYDGIDRCPQTDSVDVQHVDTAGCAPDFDADGVPDFRDSCLNSASNAAVDSIGCPADLDNDGVENQHDQCPDTPAKLPDDQRGCPELTKIFVKCVYQSLFESGESKIISEKAKVLDSVVMLLKTFPEVSVMVYGYTDDVGPNDGNLQLSQKRANAVKSYLVAAGLVESRVLAIGRGETNFVASNRTRSGREQNRSIEVEFKF